MVKVYLNDVLVAEGENPPVVEGNYYFPPSAIKKEYFTDSQTHTTCPWKGKASYYNLNVGETNVNDAAWYYPAPKDAAKNIEGHVAFYKNKVVIKE
ncbi:SubName: Full=Uncharacterized protein {ECO:0000313/EMBL:CCA74770.1} [Serendipita indica DSM 11827]|uniref:DUF427 domain-containing protein n=1 Tax=Serendipita indica (strain DSM 11827) TaxID=1109443 RepID=G4TTX7_SERID|nr:SubName: Full=Uncharacterized protein {ECO:0000313/EMBL:CCA74770.1} [Serendipita indica DSM 11827]CCA74770.1 hypothetical protein PIIN_11701 [Serendipita indica DSM 11827]